MEGLIMDFELETVKEIWDNRYGNHIEVSKDRDGLDLIEIRAYDGEEPDIAYARFTLEPVQAKLVAIALMQFVEADEDKANQEKLVKLMTTKSPWEDNT
jgi:hypothetical protein